MGNNTNGDVLTAMIFGAVFGFLLFAGLLKMTYEWPCEENNDVYDCKIQFVPSPPKDNNSQ